jgi:hypothetical protein
VPAGFISLDAELGWTSAPGEHWDIVGVEFGDRTGWQLRIEIEALAGTQRTLIFTDLVSFRMQDEAEIYGYWTDRNAEGGPVAAIYSIGSSAYLDEIGTGLAAQMVGPLTHYLVGGQNMCVEVIGRSPPTLA